MRLNSTAVGDGYCGAGLQCAPCLRSSFDSCRATVVIVSVLLCCTAAMEELCMRFGGQKAATALLLLLALACSMRIAAQDLDPASSITADPVQLSEIQAAAAAAAAADPALSMQRLSTRQGSPIQKPAGKTLLPPNRKLTKLPQMRPLSMREMKAQYKGAQAPMTSLSTGRGPIDSQAYGTSGASFSASRFTADYYTLGKQRVGTLFSRIGGDWYVCTASVINR